MASHPISVDPSSPFPIENIPFGIFSRDNGNPDQNHRGGTILGTVVVDLAVLEKNSLLASALPAGGGVFSQPTLNAFAALPRATRVRTRETIIQLLEDAGSALFTDPAMNRAAFYQLSDVQLHLPMHIPEFTDFSCFEEHVGNCFKISKFPFGPDAPFYQSPIAYNGRTSSIIPGGAAYHRPRGIFKDARGQPKYQPCGRLDYELEMGVLISEPVQYGQTITADEAAEHIFGFVLVNDWSARDIQMYESFPAGPFNCKSFATSLSSWVIVPEALSAARASPIHQVQAQSPSHLAHASLEDTTYEIQTEVYLARAGKEQKKLSTTNLKHAYFSIGQALAHRASSGCGLRTGELVAMGTMSSPAELQVDPETCHRACLFELSWDGTQEVPIVGGTFLEDGDRVTLDAWATGTKGRRIGFGGLSTEILPCVPLK